MAQALEVGWDPILSGIGQAKPVFGRGEQVQAEGRTIRLLLAKNPTGFNEVLRTLFSDGIPRHVLFILQDNIADGRDVSWIWDVDFERAVVDSAGGKTASAKFNAQLQSTQTDIEKRQKELDDQQKKLQNGSRTLSDTAKADLQKDIDRRTTELKRLNEDAQKELQGLRDELLRPIAERAIRIL